MLRRSRSHGEFFHDADGLNLVLIGRLESRRIGARSALGGRIRSVYNRGEARKIPQSTHSRLVADGAPFTVEYRFFSERRANSDTRLPSSFAQTNCGNSIMFSQRCKCGQESGSLVITKPILGPNHGRARCIGRFLDLEARGCVNLRLQKQGLGQHP